MRLGFTGDRVLAVMAHPDDVELLCAGTLARAKADGADVGIAVMCRGDKGVGSETLQPGLDEVRRSEATAAAEVLAARLFWIGIGDGELFDSYENRRTLIEVYRQFRPTLVITHSPADYHADHRAAAAIAEPATWSAASRGNITRSAALEKQPKLWFADTVNMSSFQPHFFIDVSDHVEVKRKMLLCHRSQVERDRTRTSRRSASS